MKKGQMIMVLKRMLSYGLVLCLVAGITDVYSLSANAKEVMQGQQVYAEGASARTGADGADDTEVIPETENREEIETGDADGESPAEEPVVEDEEGSNSVDRVDSDAGEGDAVTEETPSEVVYDPQPTNRQEVEAIINAFQDAWEEAVAAGGDLEAVLASKPHWQYEVPGEWMPSEYRCEKVEDDVEFGTEYYTFFAEIMPTANYFISDFATLKSTIEYAATNLDIEITGGFDFTGSISIPYNVSVTLHSAAGSNYVLLQTAEVKHFLVRGGGTLVLKNITLDGDSGPTGGNGQGGVVVNTSAKLLMEDGTIIKKCTEGGVRLHGGEMIMNGGKITNNTTSTEGGGIKITGQATFIMNEGTISGNQSSNGGGVGTDFYEASGTTEANIILNGGIISDNRASNRGGGVLVQRGSLKMTGGIIEENKAVYGGGGILIGSISEVAARGVGGDVSLTGGTIRNNVAYGIDGANGVDKGRGGGIYLSYSHSYGDIYNMKIDGVVISNNRAGDTNQTSKTGGGGGIYASGRVDIVMDSGEISGNVAGKDGGGINISGPDVGGHFTMNGGAIEGNEVEAEVRDAGGGGIHIISSVLENRVVINGGKINNNVGEGIYIGHRAGLEINGGEIIGNRRGIWWGETSDLVRASISNCNISNNISPGAGGGIATKSYSNLYVAEDVVFSGNQSEKGYCQPLPNIVELYPNIKFAQSSFTGTDTLYTDHVLNNYDIYYISYNIEYSPNGGVGTNYRKIVAPGSYTVLSNSHEELRYTKPGGWVFSGWNTSSNGSGTSYGEGQRFKPGSLVNPGASITLYAQWTAIRPITISNTVTGSYGNREKGFEIKITLKDGTNTPVNSVITYTGQSTVSGVAAPADGSLSFDETGSASIILKHGQAITLAALPAGYQYQVVEKPESTSGYIVTYNGTNSSTGVGNTIGTSDEKVAIVNDKSTIPTTGIVEGGDGLYIAGIGASALLATYVFLNFLRRRRCVK